MKQGEKRFVLRVAWRICGQCVRIVGNILHYRILKLRRELIEEEKSFDFLEKNSLKVPNLCYNDVVVEKQKTRKAHMEEMTMTLKLTALETQVMTAIPTECFYEQGFKSILWSDCFMDTLKGQGMKATSIPGVISSLSKKGALNVEHGPREDGRNTDTISLTDEGIEWMKANVEGLDEQGYAVHQPKNEEEVKMTEEIKVANEVAGEEVKGANEEAPQGWDVAETSTEEIEVLDETAQSPVAEEQKVEEQPTAPQPTAKEETTSKRKVGKGVQWFVNGVLHMEFPSIKACALFIKEEKGLKNMPFTPIMKSIRQGIDWNENSFTSDAFPAVERDAAEVTKASKEDVKDETNPPVASSDEEIVEIKEDEVVEENKEETKGEEQSA